MLLSKKKKAAYRLSSRLINSGSSEQHDENNTQFNISNIKKIDIKIYF